MVLNDLDIPIATPRGIEFCAPPTAPSTVNDAADHLAGNWPEFNVKPLKETQTAEKDMERLIKGLNATYELLSREYGKALHRTMAIHGGWSGMMAARVGVREGWDVDNPTIKDIYWHPVDPRYVFPDPGSLGKEFVIYRRRATVGSVRQAWPDWEGQWYSPAGWGNWNTGPDSRPKLNERLPDWMVVDWIEYWDDKVKCFLSNGYPVFREQYGQDLLPHGLGINPFIIRSSGYGDDTGEPHERFRSILYSIFNMLESEARLWTQYKWIIEDTAWPVMLAHDSLRSLDLEPGKVNYASDINVVDKGIRSVRDDGIEPKAVVDTLTWVQSTIERATYPQVLRGQAPNGVRSGYPIAILSTQAKLKFASPADALQAMLEELAYKTLAVVKNRFQTPCEVIDGYKLQPDDYDKYLGRVQAKLEPNLPTDKAALIPILELAVGSLGYPKEHALKDLGMEDPVELRDLRLAEDLAEDPRVRQVMAEHLIKNLAPEYAEAVMQETQTNLQLQKMQENIQLLQGRLQEMQMQMQMQQMLGQQQQTGQQQEMPSQPGNDLQSMEPQRPTQSQQSQGQVTPPMPPQQGAPPGNWGGQRPGAGGSPPMGQNPQNPNNMGQSFQTINPMTALSEIARNMRAQKSIADISSQTALYGNPGTAQL